jgi:hypothetical protein
MLRDHILGKAWDRIRELLEDDHPENTHLRQALTYWELASSFVNRGLLHPAVYLDLCDEGLMLYAALEEHLPRIRKAHPRFALQTEAVLRDHPEVRGRVLELRGEVFKRRRLEEEKPEDA